MYHEINILEAQLEDDLIKLIMVVAKERLSDRLYKLFLLRYGLDGSVKNTFKKMAEKLDLKSAERARQLFLKAEHIVRRKVNEKQCGKQDIGNDKATI